ncbi:MAG: hypothetical protein AAB675_03985 [Patescibacteria group bacterium]
MPDFPETPQPVVEPSPKPVTILDALGAAKKFITGPGGENDHPLSPNASVNPAASEFQAVVSPIPTPDSPVVNTVSSPPESPWTTPDPVVEPTSTTVTNTSPGSQETFGQSNDTNLPVSPAAGFTAPIAPSMEQTARALNELASTPAFRAQSETIRAGIDQGPPVVVNMADDEAQDAPETPEEAQKQREEAWSRVMDQMEEDVENHGWYFAKFGDKNDTDTQRDSRALILRAPITLDGERGFVAVTREGIRFIKVSEEHFDNVNKQIEARINEFNHAPESAPKVGSYHDGTVILNDPGFVGSGRFKPKEIDESNLKIFESTLAESRTITNEKEKQRKIAIKEYQDAIDTANKVSELLKSQPPSDTSSN